MEKIINYAACIGIGVIIPMVCRLALALLGHRKDKQSDGSVSKHSGDILSEGISGLADDLFSRSADRARDALRDIARRNLGR